ncbi:hypothetical protein VTN77DRAFT_5214 [Rasamsonia byssochlamydoides]|uniref:uncharacterized protein n=1 Tax=Rasamsonia byssochlamydoides TaxID=89139 RepID=UPI00374444CF
MADDGSHLAASQSLTSSTSSLSSSKLCSQIYKTASQLFLTRRLQESLAALTPIITVPATQDDERYTNGDDATPALAPIATASSTMRIKVWNLYITLLSNIVDLGPEEGKQAFGQKEWKALVNKVRDGEIWEEIVRIGYRGLEGSVDADVVYNLATLLLNHSSSQTLNQQRLETYLSAYGQPDLDITAHLQDSPSGSQRHHLPRNGGTDTPKDLTARVKIIELFTLHVLPRNEEWDYAREFIRHSEVLDEERKDVFLQTLEGLKEEKERGNQRAAELQREKEAELERQMREEEQRKAEAAAAERLQQNGHKRTSSEVDYGIEKEHPNGVAKEKQADKPSSSGKSIPPSGRTPFSPSPPPGSSKKIKKAEKPAAPVSRQARALLNVLRNILRSLSQSVVGNPMAFLRTLLFTLGILMALSRQDVRERIRKLTNTSWQKIRGTVGMGMKVSYI